MKAKITVSLVKALEPKDQLYTVRDTKISGFMLRVYPTGKMAYYLDYRTGGGKRKSYRIGNHGNLTPAQARDVAEKKAGEVANGKDVQQLKIEARAKAKSDKVSTLGEFLAHKYGPWVSTERKTGLATLKRIKSNFEFLNSKYMEDFTPWVIDKWRSEQRKTGKNPTTINRDVVALKSALSKAVEWGILEAHPLSKVKPLEIDNHHRTRWLTEDEEKRLRETLDQREQQYREARASGNEWRRDRRYSEMPDLSFRYSDHIKPMTLVTLNTGMRRGELFQLPWDSVNFQTNLIKVNGQTSKSGKTRHIPLNAESKSVLESWKKQSIDTAGLVFPGKDGNPFDNVKRAWAAVLEKAKITDFRWHDMRHHFASKLVMAGVDLYTVAELLGHQSIEVTKRYSHLAPEHLEKAVAKLISNN
jgi:site-specific recombinase XerD